MKKLLALLMVVATLFCVAACGGNEDTTTTTTAAQNDTTTTTVANDEETTTVADETETTTVADATTTTKKDDATTTTKKADATTTTTKKDETTITTKKPGINGVDPANSGNWDKVVNNVFTSKDGGLQVKADGWRTYGLYSISMVPTGYDGTTSTNAICIQVYDPDSATVFANKTKADFEAVLSANIQTFEKTTVCGYSAYKAVTTMSSGLQYFVWVVNTPNHKYFINFMQVEGQADMHAIGKQMMSTIEIYK